MIPVWNVKLIKVGEFFGVDKSALAHFAFKGEIITAPMWCLAVYNHDHKIIIDTGIHDVQWARDNVEPGADLFEGRDTVGAIEHAMGWKPDDVDTVILTHLHYDHCGQADKFKNAKIFVQKKEWEVAHDNTPTEARFYYSKLFDKKAVNYFQWEMLDGDTEIFPGLAVVTTPGHTRGHQSALINIAEGVVCFSGDSVNVIENINDNLEPGILIDGLEIYKSYKRIREFATFIIPSHDPSLDNYATGGFPMIK